MFIKVLIFRIVLVSLEMYRRKKEKVVLYIGKRSGVEEMKSY